MKEIHKNFAVIPFPLTIIPSLLHSGLGYLEQVTRKESVTIKLSEVVAPTSLGATSMANSSVCKVEAQLLILIHLCITVPSDWLTTTALPTLPLSKVKETISIDSLCYIYLQFNSYMISCPLTYACMPIKTCEEPLFTLISQTGKSGNIVYMNQLTGNARHRCLHELE